MSTLPTTSNTGLDRIRRRAQAFYDIVARTAIARPYDIDLCLDAYNRLSRLRDRYEHEKHNHTLAPLQLAALKKVFEQDEFIKGMLNARQIGEHVQRRSRGEREVQLYTTEPIHVPVEVSVEAFFCRAVYVIKGLDGKVRYHHLDQLQKAEQRVRAAMQRAMADKS
jgi:hypothetical protein